MPCIPLCLSLSPFSTLEPSDPGFCGPATPNGILLLAALRVSLSSLSSPSERGNRYFRQSTGGFSRVRAFARSERKRTGSSLRDESVCSRVCRKLNREILHLTRSIIGPRDVRLILHSRENIRSPLGLRER